MANLMDLLQGQLSEGLIDQLSQQLGGTDKKATQVAAQGAISTLMSALSKNAQSTDGASALASALDNDHDGGILDNLGALLGQAAAPQEPAMPAALNGAGILKHVLGGKQSNAIDMIAKMSGLGGNETGNLMTMLAPMVMGMLGRQKKQDGLDAGGIAQFLMNSVGSASAKQEEMGLIGKLLDQDGDGSVMDDLAGMGMKMFGKFLNK
ncbi:MAG: hypothetical protein ACI8YQ_001670 [Polaribacter sp.]|jgi:hypothetical protein